MRKIREVLRLKLSVGLTDGQVARSCKLARSTVVAYIRRAREAGLSWPLPEELDDSKLEEQLFGETVKRRRAGQRQISKRFMASFKATVT